MKNAEELLKDLPALYETDGNKMVERVVYHRFTTRFNEQPWFWNILEGGKEEDGDVMFFGYVEGFSKEFGYFRLSDLKLQKEGVDLIEQIADFKPTKIVELYPALSSWDDDDD